MFTVKQIIQLLTKFNGKYARSGFHLIHVLLTFIRIIVTIPYEQEGTLNIFFVLVSVRRFID